MDSKALGLVERSTVIADSTRDVLRKLDEVKSRLFGPEPSDSLDRPQCVGFIAQTQDDAILSLKHLHSELDDMLKRI